MTYFLALSAALYGLVIGSAINAFVWRLYVGRSWTRGRSICPECKHELAAKDLVPVLSWLALRGRCRYCRAPIKDHPIVEVTTAALFGLSLWVLMPNILVGWIDFGIWIILLVMLIVMAVYDSRWMILPDRVMLPTIIVSLIYVCYHVVIFHSIALARGPILAAFGASAAFFVIVALSKGRAMGGGDIKLVLVMGLLLGMKATVLALLIAFNSAAIVGVVLILTKLKRRRDHIPFGPFLVAGTVIAFLYGHSIINWYLHLNGLA